MFGVETLDRHVQGIELLVLDALDLLGSKLVLGESRVVLTKLWLHKVLQRLPRNNVGSGKDQLALRIRKVVLVLVVPVSRVEELKDPVALNVYRLYKHKLVVRPLFCVRMRGSVFRNLGTGAVLYLTEQYVPNNWCWEYLSVLAVRSLR